MAYHFKLEAVLNYRRNLEELAQQKLGREMLILESHNARLASLKEKRVAVIAEFEEAKKKQMAAPMFSFYMESIRLMEREIEGVRQMIASQHKAVELARLALAEKVRDKKVMEKAKERDYRNYQSETMKKEQNEADEQMVLRFGRPGNLS